MKILGYTYRVIEESNSDFAETFGKYHVAKQLIQIAGDLIEEQRIATILHEIIEILNYHLELDLKHNVIMSLEAGLFQVLIENGIDLSPLVAELEKKDA